MIRSIRSSVLAVIAVALAVASASAAPVAYKIDPSHSEVGFKIRHFFSKVPGRFNDVAGTVSLDDKNLAASSVDVTIQTASINTNNERRDNHLRSDDFFSAEKFPTITFKSTKVIPGEDKKFKVEGDLTMRGVTKPVTLDAELVGVGAIGMGGNVVGTRAGFDASTTVNRKDWGILWNKTLDNGGTMLDDMVTIDLNVEAVKDESKKDDAKPTAAATKGSAKK
jgi:polyisoprenoid-binding protein YceI